MNRRGLLAMLLMPFGQQTWGEGNITLSGTARMLPRDWEVSLPDKLTVSTKDGWSKTFTHDEIWSAITAAPTPTPAPAVTGFDFPMEGA